MGLPTATWSASFTTGTITHATDVAGLLTVTGPINGLAGTIKVTFGYTYAVAPIVVITAANSVGASSFYSYYVSSTTTDFTLTTTNTSIASYYYQVIETQSGNGSGTFAATTGLTSTAASVAQGTDIAGVVSFTPGNALNGTLINLTFGYSYTTSPIVVFSAANPAAKALYAYIYSNSGTRGTASTTEFTLDSTINGNNFAASSCAFNYHIIETQSANGTFGPITTTTYNAGAQARFNCTDVAGNVEIVPTLAAGTVTFPFANAYAVAPIVIISPIDSIAPGMMLKVWVSSTVNDFTINCNAPLVADAFQFAYHVIETQ